MQRIATIVIIAFLYTTIAKFSEYLGIYGSIVSPVWPPAGIAFASTLIFGDIALIGIFIGCLIADFYLATGNGVILISLINGLVPAIGAAAQAYVGKLGLIRYTGSTDVFKNTRSVMAFIFIAAFASCLINASLGTLVFISTGYIPINQFAHAWFTWWIADAVGVITVASIILAWQREWHKKSTESELIKIAITWFGIFVVSYLSFTQAPQLMYLLISFAILAAFQFQLKYSLLTGLLISSVCLYGAIFGYSEFIGTVSTVNAITFIQLFISIIFLTILLINVILSDRKTAYHNLESLNSELEQRVLSRTKDLLDSNQQLETQRVKLSQAFDALKQSHARLMQTEKMASLGVLTAGVAHEIKNPMNAISGNVDLIKDNMDQVEKNIYQYQLDEAVIKSITDISENTKSLVVSVKEGVWRTVQIIADLCSFAQADDAVMAATDIQHNIDSTLNLLSSEIKGHIQIVKEYNPIPNVYCLPGKINQVIMNILVNAIHALNNKTNAIITIKTEKSNDSVLITIKDNGPGIKKEVVDKIFTPFFTTKKYGQGSGLGLFLSYSIVREHNGTLSVSTEINQGTEFTIVLPVKGV